MDINKVEKSYDPYLNNPTNHSKFKTSKFQTKCIPRSLPGTPRSQSNDCSTENGDWFRNGINGSSTPFSCNPRLASQFLSKDSFDTFSPDTSHYATCPTSVLNDSSLKIPRNLPFSSLPLHEDELVNKPQSTLMSRPISEPCIKANQNLTKDMLKKHNSLKNKNKMEPPFMSSIIPKGSISLSEQHNRNDYHEALELQWKFIRTLMDELGKHRRQNMQLTVDLNQAQSEIQILKCTLEAYTEAGLKPGFVSEMIRRVHSAQKLKEKAMMARIEMANEERDVALAQSRSLLQKLGLSPRGQPDDMEDHILPKKQHHGMLPSALWDWEGTGLNLSSVKDEDLNEFKVLHIDDEEKDSGKDSCSTGSCSQKGKPNSRKDVSDETLEELRKKLSDSESSTQQLETRCSKLEDIFSCLSLKMDNFNANDRCSLSSNRPYRHSLNPISKSANENCSANENLQSFCLREDPGNLAALNYPEICCSGGSDKTHISNSDSSSVDSVDTASCCKRPSMPVPLVMSPSTSSHLNNSPKTNKNETNFPDSVHYNNQTSPSSHNKEGLVPITEL